ncbi:MAG: recombinase family protein [Hungatella sp.]|uniref:recombinase family protein n=1 Tax=Hungatella sp. TaxID=2613924 RepID=UPI00399171F2
MPTWATWCRKAHLQGNKREKECAPREEWDIVSGTHEPIITMEQFEQVQQIRSQRREKYRETVEKREILYRT